MYETKEDIAKKKKERVNENETFAEPFYDVLIKGSRSFFPEWCGEDCSKSDTYY